MKLKKHRLRAARFFEFPPEVTAGGTSVTLYENVGCTVERYGEILCYGEMLLRLRTNGGILRIEGKCFEIAELDDETLMLRGAVRAVTYETRE